jgi:anti-anti-sigma factor
MVPEPRPTPDRLTGGAPGPARPATTRERPSTGVLVVHLHVDLDHLTCELVQAQVEAELARTPTCRLILDLTDADALAAAGIRMLLHLWRLCRHRDITLVLVGTGHHGVHVPLRCSGVLPLFDTRPSVFHALPAPSLTAARGGTR